MPVDGRVSSRLFLVRRVDSDSRRFRHARELVQHDVLGKVRERRKGGMHYALPALVVAPSAQRSVPRPHPADERCPFPLHFWSSQSSISIFVMDKTLLEQASRLFARSESTDR